MFKKNAVEEIKTQFYLLIYFIIFVQQMHNV